MYAYARMYANIGAEAGDANPREGASACAAESRNGKANAASVAACAKQSRGHPARDWPRPAHS